MHAQCKIPSCMFSKEFRTRGTPIYFYTGMLSQKVYLLETRHIEKGSEFAILIYQRVGNLRILVLKRVLVYKGLRKLPFKPNAHVHIVALEVVFQNKEITINSKDIRKLKGCTIFVKGIRKGYLFAVY